MDEKVHLMRHKKTKEIIYVHSTEMFELFFMDPETVLECKEDGLHIITSNWEFIEETPQIRLLYSPENKKSP